MIRINMGRSEERRQQSADGRTDGRSSSAQKPRKEEGEDLSLLLAENSEICRDICWQHRIHIFPSSALALLSALLINPSFSPCNSPLFFQPLVSFFSALCLLSLSVNLARMSSSTSEGEPPCGSELHVLAVDDNSVDRKLIERLLKSSAYRVTTVESGKRALELLGLGKEVSTKKPKVNMIITDYCMPEMTGFDLLKRVKESSTLREIPVVIMSSENVPNRISRCLEEGAEEFLLKPLRPSDVSRLRDHINRLGRVS